MKTRTPLTNIWILALLLLGLTACDTATGVNETDVDGFSSEDLTTLSATLNTELSLTASQTRTVNATMDSLRGIAHTPGFLWYMAAHLQATLTDEQKQRLFERTESIEGGARFRHLGGFEGAGDFQGLGDFRPEGGGNGGIFGRRGGFHRPGGFNGRHDGGFLDSLLTDDQKAQVATIRESYKADKDALVEAKRNGDLTVEAFRAEMKALHEAMKAEIEALLTDDQKAALDQYIADKQAEIEAKMAERQAAFEAYLAAVREARNDALAATDAQAASLDSLQEAHKAARQALIEQFRNGDLTLEEVQTEMDALAAAEDDALTQILDATQLEIVQIHDALSVRSRRIAQNRRGGGPNGGLGGVNGPGGRDGGPGGRRG